MCVCVCELTNLGYKILRIRSIQIVQTTGWKYCRGKTKYVLKKSFYLIVSVSTERQPDADASQGDDTRVLCIVRFIVHTWPLGASSAMATYLLVT